MKKLFLLLSISIAFCLETLAQGCSDAGVCTIHAIKNNTIPDANRKNRNTIVAGLSFGKGEDDINYFNPYLEYTRSFGNTSISGKLNYSAINGRLATTSGLGDLFISLNQLFDTKKAISKSFIVGLKLPLGASDLSDNGIKLPMPYQPSLGTIDLVAGLNFFYRNFGATAAIQQPLNSSNDNEFLPSDYPSHPFIYEYLPTNEFNRKGDALVRVSYDWNWKKNFSIRPSLLGIYHLDDDSYLNNSGARVDIYGSRGLTLNWNLFFSLGLGKASAIELALGSPFVIRPTRPDGLTRSFVSSLEYKINF